MSTSSTATARDLPSNAPIKSEPIIDARFAKKIVLVCGIVPALLLVLDAWRGMLGVNSVNFAIRSTGLVGIVFLTLSLVVTPLRRLTGWASLVAVRRNLGVYGFAYILAHFVIFFVYDRDLSITSTLHEMYAREYLIYGSIALILMIPLTITSTDGMVTRLGAKRWKLLHRAAYAVVFLGAYHYYLLQKSDRTRPTQLLWLLGGLMAFRVGAHYWDLRKQLKAAQQKAADERAKAKTAPAKKKFWSGELEVARIFDETPDVKTFRFVSPGGGPLPFEHVAGQYLNLALTIDGKRVNRSYTIASSPTRGAYCEISVKRDGLASKHLHGSWREGQLVKVSAPAGKFVFAGHESDRVVLIAGGVGITPMMSVIRSLTDRCWSGAIYLVFSVRKLEDIIFRAELEHLQQRFPNLKVCITLTGEGGEWTGKRGHISRALLDEFVPDLKKGPVLLCGPDKMMGAMRKLLVGELGLPDAEVLEEAFVSPTASAEGSAPSEPVEVIPDGDVSCSFQRSGRVAEARGLTVLEAAEEAGVAMPFECRSGVCGQCKTKLISGRVAMESQDALTAADRKKGLILACQARAVQNVVVDA